MFERTIIAFIIFSVYALTCTAKCINKPGGISIANINDPDVIAAAKYAINYQSNISPWNTYGFLTTEKYVISDAQSQIVTGIKYYLKVEFPDSKLLCKFQVIQRFEVKSWLNNYSMVHNDCYYIDQQITVTQKALLTSNF